LKEAYAAEFAATIERAEKQIILARHGRRLLNLLDDTPVVPGDIRPGFEHGNQARQILNDAEDDLRDWTPELEDVTSSAHLSNNLLPGQEQSASHAGHQLERTETTEGSIVGDDESAFGHRQHDQTLDGSRISSGGSVTTGQRQSYPQSEATSQVA
jgi:hypothetical protein